VKVYIGYDEREARAVEVAIKSLCRVAPDLEPELLCAAKLTDQGLLWRVADHRGGQDYDLVSNAKKSTRFALSRFLTPIVCQQGFALFTDCDVVFREDPREMMTGVKAHHAVNVVNHAYKPSSDTKMMGQANTPYSRKNWSSVMLFNNERCRSLTAAYVNSASGLELHRFRWIDDALIGDLPGEWNWLVTEYDYNPGAKLVHYTLGGPWFDAYRGCEYADEWFAERESMKGGKR
jgi:hypothetical protein